VTASDDRPPPHPELLTALTTEHFVLQTVASTTVSEASSRASLYLLSLSSSLVAMGFAARTDAFVPLVATVLPVVIVLGVFTTVRLVDTGVQNLQVLSDIAHIRAYYRTLGPDAASYFPARAAEDPDDALASMGLQRRPATAVFTMASMISLINSMVLAVGVTLLVAQRNDEADVLAYGAGTIVALAATTVFYRYQSRRYQALHESHRRARERERERERTA
jgi:hypothetical protein